MKAYDAVSSPRSTASNWDNLSEEGGATSTPITSKSVSCERTRVPRLPQIPVIKTRCFPWDITPDSEAVRGERFAVLVVRAGDALANLLPVLLHQNKTD